MDRLTFLNILGLGSLTVAFETIHKARKPIFLGGDQADNQAKIFSKDKLIWSFELGHHRPTDVKRLDWKHHKRAMIACHGAIFDVPVNDSSPTIRAESYPSCHSVERLPDGSYISACSNDNTLRLHFRSEPQGNEIWLKDFEDHTFGSAHGVVYDKTRKCIWAIGQHLARFEYVKSPRPKLRLMEEFPLPYGNTDGHDLFPNANGNLLISTHEAAYEMTIGQFDKAKLLLEMPNIKSVVAENRSGAVYITEPIAIEAYEPWQTNQVLNLNSMERTHVPNSMFYKVRLWQKNRFSY